jgi:hypothetical protein
MAMVKVKAVALSKEVGVMMMMMMMTGAIIIASTSTYF